ncbi:MAG: archease [Desulfobacterota bacterium]|nr:archease [Thermodesulfobacteriota bacterium]
MRNFRFIDHTADIGVIVSGKTLPELFQTAAKIFFLILTELRKIEEKEPHPITLEAPGLEELMVTWLNEFLFLFETKGLLFRRFDIKNLSQNYLKATAWGERYIEEKHPIKRVIKAVTFHQLQIVKKNGYWQTRIIFDL